VSSPEVSGSPPRHGAPMASGDGGECRDPEASGRDAETALQIETVESPEGVGIRAPRRGSDQQLTVEDGPTGESHAPIPKVRYGTENPCLNLRQGIPVWEARRSSGDVGYCHCATDIEIAVVSHRQFLLLGFG